MLNQFLSRRKENLRNLCGGCWNLGLHLKLFPGEERHHLHERWHGHRMQNQRAGPPTPVEELSWIPVFTLSCDFPGASLGCPAPAGAKCGSSESRMNESSLWTGHCCLSLTYHTNFFASTFPLGCGFRSSGWCNKLLLLSACWVRLLLQRKQFIVLRLEGTITIILLVMH